LEKLAPVDDLECIFRQSSSNSSFRSEVSEFYFRFYLEEGEREGASGDVRMIEDIGVEEEVDPSVNKISLFSIALLSDS
jgi:hypothetical protein